MHKLNSKKNYKLNSEWLKVKYLKVINLIPRWKMK